VALEFNNYNTAQCCTFHLWHYHVQLKFGSTAKTFLYTLVTSGIPAGYL